MSVLGDILGKILGAAKAVASGGSASAAPSVDVDAVVSKYAAQKTEKLDWKNSIVDLMKVLDLDSSLGARKQLAKELKYDGDMNDSATMNVWLHKQVVQKLIENGGKVPDSLKH
jgi:HEAT repeat protein